MVIKQKPDENQNPTKTQSEIDLKLSRPAILRPASGKSGRQIGRRWSAID
jgi:hypothetical protein